MKATAPIARELLLVGGGHAHVHVMTAFAMRPEPGLRVTLVSKDLETPYSGMLPGHVAGFYTREEAHIDLVKLAVATGTRLIHATACGLDRTSGRVLLEGRPPLAYDLLSIDVGITPALDAIPGAADHGIAVKPIGDFLEKFEELRARVLASEGPFRIMGIGGGAGGAELILSLRVRLRAELTAAGQAPDRLSFALATAGPLLEGHNEGVQRRFRIVMGRADVARHENRPVAALEAGLVRFADGGTELADAILVTTHAAAPGWFRGTGLELDEGGFLAIGPTLQSVGDPSVFAAGDCAALTDDPRPKAGVFAVRAGPPLARNLRAVARGEMPKPWKPQKEHLALISTGERAAIASRGRWSAEGAWLWRLKDFIDRRWMGMYQDTERMAARMASVPAARPVAAAPEQMRCGGCAAKVGPGPLDAALARLDPALPDPAILIGLGAPDDAAVIKPTAGRNLVQTVDFFRAFVDDPFVFGEIAANHALSDIFAMGAEPRHALAIAVVPHAAPRIVEEELFQMLAGARRAFDREGVSLAGGHSGEGAELALGFSVTGEILPGRISRKAGARKGDVLVLTKPLGSGIVFAAAMRGKAGAAPVEAVLAAMRRSNREAARILVSHGAHAMTDVTGFGLAGHLGEMAAAGGVSVALRLADLPLHPQVRDLAEAGVASTALPQNLVLAGLLDGKVDAGWRVILFDPQTAGGLLASLPVASAEACVAELAATGHAGAAAIGEVIADGLSARDVRLAIVP